MKRLLKSIYKVLPSKKYNPDSFNLHITIHVDNNYKRILKLRDEIKKRFNSFEIEVSSFGLFEIYPSKLLKKYFVGDSYE